MEKRVMSLTQKALNLQIRQEQSYLYRAAFLPPLLAGVGGSKGSSSILDVSVNKSQKWIFLLENILSPWNCWMPSVFRLHSLELDLAFQLTAILRSKTRVCTITCTLKNLCSITETQPLLRAKTTPCHKKRGDRSPVLWKGSALLIITVNNNCDSWVCFDYMGCRCTLTQPSYNETFSAYKSCKPQKR